MKRKMIAFIFMVAVSSESFAGLVTYQSDHGAASGYYIGPRGQNETYFSDRPTTISISYEFDPDAIPIIHSGTTTYSVASLKISTGTPGISIRSQGPESTISWNGDALEFHGVEGSETSNLYATIDAIFPMAPLAVGELPSTLALLHGVHGYFEARRDGGVGYGGSSGIVYGSFVSSPEPSSIVMMALGFIGLAMLAKTSRHRS